MEILIQLKLAPLIIEISFNISTIQTLLIKKTPQESFKNILRKAIILNTYIEKALIF